MRFSKSLLILLFLFCHSLSFANGIKIMIAANESVVGKPAVIIESAAQELENPPHIIVASKLFIREGDTLGSALKAAKELGIDYVLTFDFTNELPNLVVSIRLVKVDEVEISKTFSFKTHPENVVKATQIFTKSRICEYLEKRLAAPAKTSILGEVSLISENGIIYLRMENNLLPPIGSVADVCNSYMVKIGEVQITDIADDYCVAVVLKQNTATPFEKGNIVKVTLGKKNGNSLSQVSHDEKYLICSECYGVGKITCAECQNGYLNSDGVKSPCPQCQSKGQIPCEFCNSIGFVQQP